ncbi:MAG: primosomal protein N' [Lachnospiraceae bacterium]|nr:primosomal protein N' [Lachnospiraceae bacterium]
MYADVIIDISLDKLDRPFSYRIPENLLEKVDVGTRVLVPFGKGNTIKKAYIIALSENTAYDPEKVKDIAGIAKDAVTIEEKQVELAAFIRKSFGGTMNQALKVVLPAKASVKKLEFREVVRLMGREELLALKGEALRKHQNAKVKLLEELLLQETIPYEWITGKLGVSSSSIASLAKAGALKVESVTRYRNPVHMDSREEERKSLSPDQQAIVDAVREDEKNGIKGRYLIHGITGSGKTEVYMALIEDVVKKGKQAIFLIPEIALTYQTLVRFFRRFGNRVSVMNSTLSPGEKYDQCMRAKNGEIDIVIGPRSALFVPFPDLGMIIMDEEHETSYKSESTPKYHARIVAEKLADMSDCAFVMGSATPSVDAYYNAQQGHYRMFKLKERLTGGALPMVSVVDLRRELKEGNRSIFSGKLKELLRDRIDRGEQSILFLNRRGYSGFISCRECGKVMKCPHCDVSLSEHYGGKLVCHYCGYETTRPEVCPECGSKYIAGFKAGTEQIEESLNRLFPGVKVLRMDADTTKTKDSYEKILSTFSNGEAQILVGTQMIVKGHDFPKVTLVGVLAADLSLGSTDFHAAERTFQLLVQAVGRAGRGELPGEAVIQTYQPEHYAIGFAAAQDYEGFFEEEKAYRSLLGYPPLAHMLAVQIFGPDRERAEKLAENIGGGIRKNAPDITEGADVSGMAVIGPAPASIGRIKDMYRFVVYIKAERYDILVKAKDLIEERLKSARLKNEIVQFDFDPVNML